MPRAQSLRLCADAISRALASGGRVGGGQPPQSPPRLAVPTRVACFPSMGSLFAPSHSIRVVCTAVEEDGKYGDLDQTGLQFLLRAKDKQIQTLETILTRDAEREATAIHHATRYADRALEREAKAMALVENENAKLVLQLANYEAVMGNRILLEIGLRQYSPRHSASAAWALFLKDKILLKGCREKGRLSDLSLDIVHELGCTGTQKHVEKDLQDLYHEVSKPHHQPGCAHGTGIVVGGKPSLGFAVALVVVHMQRLGFITNDVRFVDDQGLDRHLLSRGKIVAPYA